MIYVASPYTHPDQAIEAIRFAQVSRHTYKLLLAGHVAFSPIVYGHHFRSTYKYAGDSDTWLAFNMKMLEASNQLQVLRLPGWNISIGVAREMVKARELGLPIDFADPLGGTNWKE